MSSKLPYVVQPSLLPRILEKVKEAKTPERFTGDFLSTKLGFKGGNARQFIPLAKKLGLLNSDGTPTILYQSLRNPANSGAAVAAALKKGYAEIFERNEFAASLSKDGLKGLVVEITGLEAKNPVVGLICQTLESLKSKADFEAKLFDGDDGSIGDPKFGTKEQKNDSVEPSDVDLRLSYNINLVLPKTEDPAVFNAIFRALRENLLRK
jgi:Family of unknown function (DUF5343)